MLKPERRSGNTVVVSIPDKKIVVRGPKGEVLREYSVYIGNAKTPTPRGQYRVMENLDANFEWYYGPGFISFAKDVHPGEKDQYYGFHGWKYRNSGADEPNAQDIKEWQKGHDTSWKTTTQGCVQLRNSDMAELAKLVGPGDPVAILDTPLAPPPPPAPKPNMQPVGGMSLLPSMFSLRGRR
jgi:lipoprotein-anchoring transpeptidase ErfK/SrfK